MGREEPREMAGGEAGQSTPIETHVPHNQDTEKEGDHAAAHVQAGVGYLAVTTTRIASEPLPSSSILVTMFLFDDPRGLERGGVAYRKSRLFSKFLPTWDEVSEFLSLNDGLRKEFGYRLIGLVHTLTAVHCHLWV
jgi:hypothetical protein